MKVPNFISGENRDSNELLDESIDGMQNHERKVIGSRQRGFFLSLMEGGECIFEEQVPSCIALHYLRKSNGPRNGLVEN